MTPDIINGVQIVLADNTAYTLSKISPAIRGDYAAWAKADAINETAKLKDQLGPATYHEMLDNIRHAVTAGEYSWGFPGRPDLMGQTIHTVLQTERGNLKLLSILLRAKHGELPEEKLLDLYAAAGARVAIAMAQALDWDKFLEKPDPNAQAPATSPAPA